jgi:hypothetical protein
VALNVRVAVILKSIASKVLQLPKNSIAKKQEGTDLFSSYAGPLFVLSFKPLDNDTLSYQWKKVFSRL